MMLPCRRLIQGGRRKGERARTMYLVLQFRSAPLEQWHSYATAPVIEMPGYGIDAAHRKLKETRDRYLGLGVLSPETETRIIRCVEPGDEGQDSEISSAIVTASALLIIGGAIAVWAGIVTHAI